MASVFTILQEGKVKMILTLTFKKRLGDPDTTVSIDSTIHLGSKSFSFVFLKNPNESTSIEYTLSDIYLSEIGKPISVDISSIFMDGVNIKNNPNFYYNPENQFVEILNYVEFGFTQ